MKGFAPWNKLMIDILQLCANQLQNSLKSKYFLFAQVMKGDLREGAITSLPFASTFERRENYLKTMLKIVDLNFCHCHIGQDNSRMEYILPNLDFYDVSGRIHSPT